MKSSKAGLMYSSAFAEYKAGDGYLCMTAGKNPLMSPSDYYDTPERVTQAYEMLKKNRAFGKACGY